MALGSHRFGRHQKRWKKPLSLKGSASTPGQEGICAWLWVPSRAHRHPGLGMDLTSSSDESLPLKSPPSLNLQFDVQFLHVFPIVSIPLCLQANCGCLSSFCPEQFPAGTSSCMTDKSLAVTFTAWLLPHACSRPAFFVFARKGKREHPQKTACLQSHPHVACSWLKALGLWASAPFSPWWQQAESQSCGWDKQQDPPFLGQERDWPQQQEALGAERMDPGPGEDAEDVCPAGLEQSRAVSALGSCCSCPFWWL